ncbi:MAG: response regulator [Chitinophagaceae bacterium]|nr:response regulator [Oligoflexus sp.]
MDLQNANASLITLELYSALTDSRTRRSAARQLAALFASEDLLVYFCDDKARKFLLDENFRDSKFEPHIPDELLHTQKNAVSFAPEVDWGPRTYALRIKNCLLVFVHPLRGIDISEDLLRLGQGLSEVLERKYTEKRLACALQKALDDAEAANRAKSIFLANMSHEIRTPLGVILGFARLIQDPLSPPEHDTYARAILRNGILLQQIFNDILDLSKIEAGNLEREISNLYLRDLVSDLIDIYRAGVEDKGLEIISTIEPEVPAVIRTDAPALRKILMNLLSNAIKFTTYGHIAILIGFKAPGVLDIRVEDTGIGIAMQDRESLFKPFFQADSSNTRQFGGTGLGLALSRHLAESLGGSLAILQSEIGKGSTFQAFLPVGIFEKSDKDEQSDNTKGRLEGKRILLAEDAEDVQMLMKRVLGRLGLSVVIARNGQVAVDLARAEHFDLVLMDMQMPLKDGLTATRELRETGYLRPIVALTANAFREDKTLFLEAGCSAYLGKPIEFLKLKATLESQLRLLDLQSPSAGPIGKSERTGSESDHTIDPSIH